MDNNLKMAESKNTDYDDLAKKMKEMSSTFSGIANELKNKMHEMEKKSMELGVEAVKIITEEAQKISDKIPEETPEEAQKQMAEGMMMAALGATSLFGNLIKQGLNLADLGIEIKINKKEDEKPMKDSEVQKDVKEALDVLLGKSSSEDEPLPPIPEEEEILSSSCESLPDDPNLVAEVSEVFPQVPQEDLEVRQSCQHHGPLPCCDGHAYEDLAMIEPRAENAVHECNDDVCVI